MSAQPAAAQPARARNAQRRTQRADLPRALSSGKDLVGLEPGTGGSAPLFSHLTLSPRGPPQGTPASLCALRHPAPQSRRRARSGSGRVARPGAVDAPAPTPHRHSPPQGGPRSGPGATQADREEPAGRRERAATGRSVARGVSPPSFAGAERGAGPASRQPPKTDISSSLTLALYQRATFTGPKGSFFRFVRPPPCRKDTDLP